MTKPTERILKIIDGFERSKVVMSIVLLPFIMVTSIGVTMTFGNTASAAILSVFASCAIGLWLRQIICNAHFDALRKKYFNGDDDAFIREASVAAEYYAKKSSGEKIEEEPQDRNVAIELTIVALPDKPLGSFKDAKIYEWIDFKGKSGADPVVRFIFDRTVDNPDNYHVEPECILLSPGIVYRLAKKSNI